MHTYLHTRIHAYIHACAHTYMHINTYIHTYIHTYMQTYKQTNTRKRFNHTFTSNAHIISLFLRFPASWRLNMFSCLFTCGPVCELGVHVYPCMQLALMTFHVHTVGIFSHFMYIKMALLACHLWHFWYFTHRRTSMARFGTNMALFKVNIHVVCMFDISDCTARIPASWRQNREGRVGRYTFLILQHLATSSWWTFSKVSTPQDLSHKMSTTLTLENFC